jgi:GT2 family glycosyltransferase
LRVSVFDNASVDGSADMVASEFPGVRLLRSEQNLGFGQGNNRLAATSTASHLLLLNSDTVLKDDIVSPLLAALEAEPAVAIVAPRLIGPEGDFQISSERLPTLRFEFARQIRGSKLQPIIRPVFDVEQAIAAVRREDDVACKRTHDAEFVWATCWLLRRADFSDGRLFDPAFPLYDEDLDACRRLRGQGRRLTYVADVELVHLGGRSSATSAAKSERLVAARTQYYRRHHGLLTALAFRFLVAASACSKQAIRGLKRFRG